MTGKREIRSGAELQALAPWVKFGPKGQYAPEELAWLRRHDYGKQRTLIEWARALEPRTAWLNALDSNNQQAAERCFQIIERDPWPDASVGEFRFRFGQQRAVVSDALVKDVVQWAGYLDPQNKGPFCEAGAQADREAAAQERHRQFVEALGTEDVRRTELYIVPIIIAGGAKPMAHRFLCVNLTAPDDALRESFERWLRESRRMSYAALPRGAGTRHIPTREHGASRADLKAWTDDKLLAVADLVLAARTVGKRATDAAIAKVLGLPATTVQKALRPRAMALIASETTHLVQQQAAVSLESKDQPKLRPRGLTARTKPRAV